jgi:hypothetical protein
MKQIFLFLFLLFIINNVNAQRFTITLKDSTVIGANVLKIREQAFSRSYVLKVNNQRIKINAINEIIDTSHKQLYKVIKFRNRYHLARELEQGAIHLYDFRFPPTTPYDSTIKAPRLGKLYFQQLNNTTVKPFNRSNFDKLFTPTFINNYPNYESIKKQYLNVLTMGIFAAVMIPNLITIVGFQSVGVLIVYGLGTSYVTYKSFVGVQKKFNKVRQMVKAYNTLQNK